MNSPIMILRQKVINLRHRRRLRCYGKSCYTAESTLTVSSALKHGVPPSTARGWVKATMAEVVTIDVADVNTLQLQQEVLALACSYCSILAGPEASTSLIPAG